MRTGSRFWLVPAVALAATLVVAGPAHAQINQLRKIEARPAEGKSVLAVKGTMIPNFTSFKLSDPFRLVVDFSESEFAGARGIEVGDGIVERVELSQHGSGSGAISRVVVTLAQNAVHRFKLDGFNLVVEMKPAGENPRKERLVSASAPRAPVVKEEPAPVAEAKGASPGDAIFRDGVPEASQPTPGTYSGLSAAALSGQNQAGEAYAGPKTLEWIGFEQLGRISRIFLRTNESPEYRVTVPDETTVVVELANTRINARNNLRFLDTSAFDSVIDMITPFEEGNRVAVEIRLRGASRYRDFREGQFVVLDFPRPSVTVTP